MRLTPFIVACLISGAAAAQTVSQNVIDFTQPLVDVTGKPVKDDVNRTPADAQADPSCSKCEVITIGQMIARCLVADTTLKPEDKPAAWFLAKRIINDKAGTLSAPEITAIEHCVDKLSPTVAGQVDPLIDPSFKEKTLQ